MERSTLYDLLEKGILQDWREKVKEADECGFEETEHVEAQEIMAELNEKAKKLFSTFSLTVENKMDFIHYNLHIKILNLGIQLGMEIQKSFIHTDEG